MRCPSFISSIGLICILGLVASPRPVRAQAAEPAIVPLAVQTVFQADYPQARRAHWVKHPEGFAVHFRTDDGSQQVVYNHGGGVMSSQHSLMKQFLPSRLRTDWRLHWRAFTMREITVVNHNGAQQYRILATRQGPDLGIDRYELLFDETGKFVRETLLTPPKPATTPADSAVAVTRTPRAGTPLD